jgi:ATP-dependent Lhr-like helicase
MLDELTATGEVIWAGCGTLAGSDGWVSLHLADSAGVTLGDPGEIELGELHDQTLKALSSGGAWFFRQLSNAVGSTDDSAFERTLWDLVWAGVVTNDTLCPPAVADAVQPHHAPVPPGSAAVALTARPGSTDHADASGTAHRGRAVVTAARSRG